MNDSNDIRDIDPDADQPIAQKITDRFAGISRHTPTPEQIALAREQGVALVPIGDRDAFSVRAGDIDGHEAGPFDGVIVVHPAAAMRLARDFVIGIYEDGERPGAERWAAVLRQGAAFL